MSEKLLIRLPCDATACAWLVYVDDDVIASGVLSSPKDLATLKNRTKLSIADVVVASQGVTLKEVELPPKAQRQAINAIGYLIEEDLVQDLEDIHFVVTTPKNNKVVVASVAHSQMESWLGWMSDAQIKINKMTPDSLCLPLADCDWAFLELDKDVIFRMDDIGISIDKGWLNDLLPNLVKDIKEPLKVATYTKATSATEKLNFIQQPLILPMQVFAKGIRNCSINLLSGLYAPPKENILWRHWRKASIAAVACLALILVNSLLNIRDHERQSLVYKDMAKQVFNTIYPNGKIINIKAQLESKYKEIAPNASGSLFNIFHKITPSFANSPDIKLASLRFDRGRDELKLQIEAKTYAQIEKLQQQLVKDFKVDMGSMTNNDKEKIVTTSITLGSK